MYDDAIQVRNTKLLEAIPYAISQILAFEGLIHILVLKKNYK